MTAAPAACFGCGERRAPELLEEVGDTVFCRACLERLLLERSGAGPRGPRGMDGTPPAPPPAAGAACFLCGEPSGDSAFVELRDFAICASCSRGLLGEDAPAGETPAPAPRPAPPAPRGDDDDDRCDACARPLGPSAEPGPHGFRLCPACLHSDPALALVLARARHRQRLARACRRILDGDDEP